LSVLILLAAFIGVACDSTTDPVASGTLSDPPATAATTDSAAATLDTATAGDSLAPAFATTSYTGVPFGPFGLWGSYTSVLWGPAPFTGSQSFVDASGIVTLINSARYKKQRLVLAMAGGASTNYTTYGKFDLAKWKKKMNTYNTSTIKNAVAAGVADGTILGNSLIDEPETVRWGGNITKPILDQMATYAKAMFPTLPMGVNHTTLYATWRTSERYYKVDYIYSPPLAWNTLQLGSSISAWRDKVLARASTDGVQIVWGLNPLGGGYRDNDNDGKWECPLTTTQGQGSYYPLCRMTANQLRDWGRTLIAATSGCLMLLWQYDKTYMSRTDNQQAFRDLAYTLGSKAKKSCRRP
jgi:hypothetical protein